MTNNPHRLRLVEPSAAPAAPEWNATALSIIEKVKAHKASLLAELEELNTSIRVCKKLEAEAIQSDKEAGPQLSFYRRWDDHA